MQLSQYLNPVVNSPFQRPSSCPMNPTLSSWTISWNFCCFPAKVRQTLVYSQLWCPWPEAVLKWSTWILDIFWGSLAARIDPWSAVRFAADLEEGVQQILPESKQAFVNICLTPSNFFLNPLSPHLCLLWVGANPISLGCWHWSSSRLWPGIP